MSLREVGDSDSTVALEDEHWTISLATRGQDTSQLAVRGRGIMSHVDARVGSDQDGGKRCTELSTLDCELIATEASAILDGCDVVRRVAARKHSNGRDGIAQQ